MLFLFEEILEKLLLIMASKKVKNYILIKKKLAEPGGFFQK